MPSKVEVWVTPIEIHPELKHTSIRACEHVFSYSEDGLATDPVNTVPQPEKIIPLGTTYKSMGEVVTFAYNLNSTTFEVYSVLSNNCNHFANELSNYLCRRDIPYYLLHQCWTALALVPILAPVGMPLALLAATNSGRKVSNSISKSSNKISNISGKKRK